MRPVPGIGGRLPQPRELGAELGAYLDAGVDRVDHVRSRAQEGFAVIGVDDHRIALRDPVAKALQAADAGNVQGAGDDRGVAGGGTLLQQDSLQLGAIVLQQVGRPEVPGDQDGVVRKLAWAVSGAGQVSEKPVVQVLQIMQPLAHVGIARLAETGPVLGAHPLDRGLGGQARPDGFRQRMVPALALGQHAVGLEHLVGGADDTPLPLHHVVDLRLQGGDGGAEPFFLQGGVVRQQLLGGDGRFVQHHLAVGDALGEADAAQPLGAVRRDLDVLELGLPQQLALGHQFGQDHGDDLQVLDLVFGVDPLGAVLHHHHAHRPAAAQERHAQEGVIGVFAGLRAVREGRMRRRVGERQRAAQAHDLAHQPFALLHAGDVHRARVQAFGGEQLHLARGAAQIDRADLRHHGARDDADHLVQLGLSRVRAGHGFADLPKQTSRTADGEAGRQGHGTSSPCWARS